MQRSTQQDYDFLLKKVCSIHPSKGDRGIIDECCKLVCEFDLSKISQRNRIILIDTAIKMGSLKLVEAIAEQFTRYKLEDDIRIPKKDHYEHPFRPTFWLAAITTRQPYAEPDSYEAIEKYLCQKFNIPEKVKIDGTLVSREEYCKRVDVWKHQQNIKLFEKLKTKMPRYRRHELMDEIKKGVTLKKNK